MPIWRPMRTTAVQSMTGIVPINACAVIGTISTSAVVKARNANFLECCRIDFLSILRRGRCQPFRVGHSEPVSDLQRRKFGMLFGKFLAKFGFQRMASARPVIKWRSSELDYRAQFRLVADEHVTLRKMSRNIAQLFDRFDRRLGKMQYLAESREFAQLCTDELGLRVLQDC